MPQSRQLLLATLLTVTASLAQSDTLVDIYELALINDPQLSAYEAAYLAGKESKNISRAGLLPSIDATASYSESNNNIDSVRVLGNGTQLPSRGAVNTDTESTVISLRQPLFNLAAWFQFQQGKQLSKQAKLTFSAEKQRQILTVANTYFAVLRSAENLTTVIAEETALSRQLEQTRQRYEVGLLPITDVHEAQATFDDALVNTLEAKGALNIAFEGIEVLTGQRHETLSGLATDFPTPKPSPTDANQWVNFAIDNNLTLQAQEFAMKAADANAKARKSDHLPTVTGSLTYTNNNADGMSLGSPTADDSEGNQATVSITMPIFAGGLTSANRRQSQQLAIQSRQNYLAAQRNTTQQTRSNHLQVITDVARVKARLQAIKSAQSALEATQAGYDVGTRNIVDVLNAQRVLFQTKRNYANARYDYIASLLQLKQVSGQLNPEDLQQLEKWLDPTLNITRAAAL